MAVSEHHPVQLVLDYFSVKLLDSRELCEKVEHKLSTLQSSNDEPSQSVFHCAVSLCGRWRVDIGGHD